MCVYDVVFEEFERVGEKQVRNWTALRSVTADTVVPNGAIFGSEYVGAGDGWMNGWYFRVMSQNAFAFVKWCTGRTLSESAKNLYAVTTLALLKGIRATIKELIINANEEFKKLVWALCKCAASAQASVATNLDSVHGSAWRLSRLNSHPLHSEGWSIVRRRSASTYCVQSLCIRLAPHNHNSSVISSQSKSPLFYPLLYGRDKDSCFTTLELRPAECKTTNVLSGAVTTNESEACTLRKLYVPYNLAHRHF
ncbi:hypothetical protein TcWFU_008321 [Taenia crassiceps]|uniref:Uncharacterized protein n=1 Tax=Taenia crassiceps TaxID=6207 RepID=A0ABR4Q968_9CEST